MSWVDRFFEFFRLIEPSPAAVLNAYSCREDWLQGEFYRHFFTAENGFRLAVAVFRPEGPVSVSPGQRTAQRAGGPGPRRRLRRFAL